MKTIGRMILVSVALCVAVAPVMAQGIFTDTADWDREDGTKVAGSVNFSGGTYELAGNGNDIWNETDEGFYVYTEKTGAWTISGLYTWIDPGAHEWAKIGPMIRDGAQDPQAVNFMVAARGAMDLVSPQWRTSTGAASGSHGPRITNEAGEQVALENNEIWLRATYLPDAGAVFCEWSRDGQDWMFGYGRNMTMSDTVAYGIAITNHEGNDFLAQGEASNVELSEFTDPIAIRSIDSASFPGETSVVTLEIANPAAGTLTETLPEGFTASNASNGGSISGDTITWTLTASTTEVSYEVAQPAGISREDPPPPNTFSGDLNGLATIGTADIGIVYPGVGMFDFQLSLGNANDDMAGLTPWLDGDVYNMYASGSDIWGGNDHFHYLFNEVSGPFMIWGTDAFIFQEEGHGTWCKGGFMVRDDLDTNSANGFAMARTDMEYRLQWRPEKGASSSGQGNRLPYDQYNGNIGLLRMGDTVQALYRDADGNVQIKGSAQVELSDPVYMGIAFTSHQNDGFGSFTISNVEVTELDGVATRTIPNKALPQGGGTSEGITVTVDVVEGKSSSATVTEILPEGFSADNINTTNGSAS
ncbi:hypothetical protein GF373_17835, partial [bacterium]|nr:hypothetical protein [bacterium]